ncbi:uncharacterized protein F4822DRAFT_411184 [Hypoxylon trugodes]|uniref:uncharacterized protein n=1 Tax=Hypoxylon trugodes TaxID=326681 RepID=UPI00219FEA1F|nr:uncharacterized protein F4822DRAFT_411184 [Hypoxylon trugodes]KAI1386777.1 hypothetical protein F4822DRAFT_411184 [Hypoxylon trugodes]
MTGAYSRVDNGNSNDNYPKTATQDPTTTNTTSARGIGATGPATGIATSARSDNTELQQLGSDDRNIVRNGLRQTSNIDHNDPYWGDVPYGTGVYNSVTGHGSSETTTEGSVPHDPSLSHEQQRAFPLSTTDNTTHGQTRNRSGSRFKEGLAGSGTAAGAGIAASDVAEKRRDHKHDNETMESATHKHDEDDTKKESKLAGLFHREHKAKEPKPEKKHEVKEEKKLKEQAPSKDNRPLTDRDAGAALAAATVAHGSDKHEKKPKESELGSTENKANPVYQHPNEKIDNSMGELKPQHQISKDPFIAAGYTGPNSQSTATSANAHPASEDVTTRGYPFTSQTTEKPADKHDSKLGYGLAAAGLGAGAGYAAHEYSNKDNNRNKEPVSQQAYGKPTTTSSKAATTTQPENTGYTIGQPQLGVVSGAKQTATASERQAVPQSGANAYDSRADPTRHGKYNVLQDGTPSGINTGDHYDAVNNTSATSPTATRNTATKGNHNGAKTAAAGAGVAGAGAAAYYAHNRDSDKIPAVETRQTSAATSRDTQKPYTSTTGVAGRTPADSSRGGEYNTLHDGTPSGVNTSDLNDSKNNAASSAPTDSALRTKEGDNHNTAKVATAAGVAGVAGTGAAAKYYSKKDAKEGKDITDPTPTTHSSQHAVAGAVPTEQKKHVSIAGSPTSSARDRTSTDSSHGGQYNVLSSGTPSGINVGERDEVGRKSLEHNTTPAKSKASPTAVHPATVSAGAAPQKDNSKERDLAKAGGIAAAPASLTGGDKVLHKCRKCGEENDITGYFQKSK